MSGVLQSCPRVSRMMLQELRTVMPRGIRAVQTAMSETIIGRRSRPLMKSMVLIKRRVVLLRCSCVRPSTQVLLVRRLSSHGLPTSIFGCIIIGTQMSGR